MDCTATRLAYKDTGYFTKIILDYLDHHKDLLPFYAHPVSYEGMQLAMHEREQFTTDRKLLVSELQKQYSKLEPSAAVNGNIEKLLQENTFTITTAH